MVTKQLQDQPHTTTRNRKRLRPNPFFPWELRIGKFRVYYQVEEDPERIVEIHAIGIKIRDVVYIAGKRVVI